VGTNPARESDYFWIADDSGGVVNLIKHKVLVLILLRILPM
jgi:hypothetical protein